MRRTIPVLIAVALLAGCGFFKKTIGVRDASSGYESGRTTSPFGEWVLDTPTDSTAFAGARAVEMRLQQGSFLITASYANRPAVTVSGSASLAPDGGLLTLTAQASGLTGGANRLAFPVGTPVSLLASASGNTLVFAPPQGTGYDPSSVWHRKDAAQRAGTTPASGTTPPDGTGAP